MSSSTFQIPAYRGLSSPLGSRIAAAVFGGFGRLFSRPLKSQALTRAEEAAEVRELASRVQATDPGFAADLYAAAARHESLDD